MSSRTASSQATVDTFVDINISDGTALPPGQKRPWRANQITTTKYTILTWLPKSIWVQFKRIANAYFLIVSVLMVSNCLPTNLYSHVHEWLTVYTKSSLYIYVYIYIDIELLVYTVTSL